MYGFHIATLVDTGLPTGQTWVPSGLGIDLVHLQGIRDALAAFGERFERRLYTQRERCDCGTIPQVRVMRLASRFAAKEAAIKAFGLAQVGVDWRELEVVLTSEGAPTLQVHGRAATLLEGRGITRWAISLSHDGDHAMAAVVILQSTDSSSSSLS